MSFPDWLRSRVFHVAKIWAMRSLVDCMLATFVQESSCVWHYTVKSLCFYFYLLSPLTPVRFSFSYSLLFHSVSPGLLSSALPTALAATQLYAYTLFRPKKPTNWNANNDQTHLVLSNQQQQQFHIFKLNHLLFPFKSFPKAMRKAHPNQKKIYKRMVDITRLTSRCP